MRLFMYLMWLSAPAAQAQTPDAAVLQRYSEEGQRALAEHRYEEAARAYEKLKELSPRTAEVHASLGLIYFQQQRFAEAVPALRRALKLNPALPKADILLSMCLSELGEFKEAVPGLRSGFRQTSDAPLRRLAGLQLVRTYTGLQLDAKAGEVALELTRLHPQDPEVLYHTGRLFANLAYLQTMKLAQVAPDSVWMHQAAGEANESQGFYDAAIREYRLVLAKDPRRPGLHFRVGRSLLSRSKQDSPGADTLATREEAVKEFEQELALDPTNANAAYELGELHRKSGRIDRARELFEAAVKQYPDFEDARIGLGRVLIASGKPELAVPHLVKAVSLNPESEVAYYQLSLGYRALGIVAEQEKALTALERIRNGKQLEPDAPSFVPQQVTKQELDPEAPSEPKH